MNKKCPYCSTGKMTIASVPSKLKHQWSRDGLHEELSRRYLACNTCGASGEVDAHFKIRPPADTDTIPLSFEFQEQY